MLAEKAFHDKMYQEMVHRVKKSYAKIKIQGDPPIAHGRVTHYFNTYAPPLPPSFVKPSAGWLHLRSGY